MTTFPTYDHTLCNQTDCSNKQNCLRFTTYQKAISEKYNFPISVYQPKETPTECGLYQQIKE